MAGFDPKAYLAADAAPAPKSFDPKAYLAADDGENTPASLPVDPSTGDQPGAPDKTTGGHALLRGLGHGVTSGNVDEGTGLMAKAMGLDYTTERNADRADEDLTKKEHPVAFGAGDMAGSALGAGAVMGAGVSKGVSSGVTSLARTLGMVGSDGEIAAKFLPRLGKMAAEMGLIGGARGEGDSTADTAGGVIGDTAKGVAEGVAAAPLGMAAGAVADTLAKGGAKAVSKTMGAGKASDAYLANPAKYNDPELNFENVQGMIDKPKNAALAAQDELSGIAGDAKSAAAAARQEHIQGLRDTSVGDDAVSATRDALLAQRAKTGGLAGQQQEMLAPIKDKYSLDGLDGILNKGMEREKIAGVSPGNDQEKAISDFQSLLNKLKTPEKTATTAEYDPANMRFVDDTKTLEPAKTELSPSDMVKLRQNIDSMVQGTYDKNTGSYSQHHEGVARDLRGGINDVLDKQLPGDVPYATTRADLAKNSQLSGQASKEFGGDNLMPKLASLSNPNSAERLALLKQLGESSGVDTTGPLQPYLNAKRTLGNPAELDQAVGKLPASQQSAEAQQFLDASKGENQTYKDLGDSQSAIRKMLFAGPNKPETTTRDLLQKVGDNSGQDVLGSIGDLKVKNAFDAAGPHGSRLVQIGKGIGGIAGEYGRAAGGAIGGMADYSTGKIAKGALDTYLAVKDPIMHAAGGAAVSALDKLQAAGGAGLKYLGVLDNAAKTGGPQAVLAAHRTLLQQDPNYAKVVGDQ